MKSHRLLQIVTAAMKLQDACSLGEKLWPTRQQRHYFANKGLFSQSYGFSSMHGCESWTIKETWALKNWCFWNCGVGEDSRVPWTERRSNQSVLKEVNPQYSLDGLILKLKLQYFGHLMWRANSLEKTLMLGKIEGQEEKWVSEDEMVRWHQQLNWHEFEQTLGDTRGQRNLEFCSSWGHKILYRS